MNFLVCSSKHSAVPLEVRLKLCTVFIEVMSCSKHPLEIYKSMWQPNECGPKDMKLLSYLELNPSENQEL